MPIEIKELYIRVAVNAPRSGQLTEGSTNIPGKKSSIDDSVKDAIIADCIEQVLQIIQNKAER